MSKIVIIYNPTAGRWRRRALYRILRELRALECEVVLRATRARGDAEAFARQARQAHELGTDAPDIVVAAGGDGTINEVLNGMVGAGLPLAIIPIGTANVLAAEVGLSARAKLIAHTITGGHLMAAHLGSANGRVFAVMAGVGMDAEVVSMVSSRLKRWIGKGAYAVAIARRLLRPMSARYKVVVGEETHEVASLVVANGHYYGGRFVCAKDAWLGVPQLHACLFKNGSRLGALQYLLWLAIGRLEHLASFEVVPCTEMTVFPVDDALGSTSVQGDGDIIASLPARIESLRAPIMIAVPAGR